MLAQVTILNKKYRIVPKLNSRFRFKRIEHKIKHKKNNKNKRKKGKRTHLDSLPAYQKNSPPLGPVGVRLRLVHTAPPWRLGPTGHALALRRGGTCVSYAWGQYVGPVFNHRADLRGGDVNRTRIRWISG
jgi:hypothetical protein